MSGTCICRPSIQRVRTLDKGAAWHHCRSPHIEARLLPNCCDNGAQLQPNRGAVEQTERPSRGMPARRLEVWPGLAAGPVGGGQSVSLVPHTRRGVAALPQDNVVVRRPTTRLWSRGGAGSAPCRWRWGWAAAARPPGRPAHWRPAPPGQPARRRCRRCCRRQSVGAAASRETAAARQDAGAHMLVMFWPVLAGDTTLLIHTVGVKPNGPDRSIGHIERMMPWQYTGRRA